ncbi:hypothetical protein VPHD479_0336 [Vibrio phage D479]
MTTKTTNPIVAFFAKLFGGKSEPRTVGAILLEMENRVKELNERASFEKAEQAKNDAEAKRVREEAAKKEQELADKNTELGESIERANRVAERMSGFIE